jgi:hypothetical protein
MLSPILRQCVAYLLIALLPLQAAAASRLALCAELANSNHGATTTMAHCAEMAQPAGSPDQASKMSHPGIAKGCWLGTICLASLGAYALPVQHELPPAVASAQIYPPLTAHYLSIVLDDPQRPPSAL